MSTCRDPGTRPVTQKRMLIRRTQFRCERTVVSNGRTASAPTTRARSGRSKTRARGRESWEVVKTKKTITSHKDPVDSSEWKKGPKRKRIFYKREYYTPSTVVYYGLCKPVTLFPSFSTLAWRHVWCIASVLEWVLYVQQWPCVQLVSPSIS